MKPKQPFYHLRPNKFIDRHLFMQVLLNLHGYFTISKYQYIGFGSFMFDDYKLFHKHLGITNLISLERDIGAYKRAKFNLPYNCIKLLNVTSTEFIATFERKKPVICWLDYTEAHSLGEQLADYCGLIDKMENGDVIRITLNANPRNLEKKALKFENNQELYQHRIKTLYERIGKQYLSDLDSTNVTNASYPVFLLSCLEKAANITLGASSSYRLAPLFSTIYADGQQMVTLTAIKLKKKERIQAELEKRLRSNKFVSFNWNTPAYIDIPPLTSKEILNINCSLPNNSKKCLDKIKKKFPFIFDDNEEMIKSYMAFYKYYPHFHHIRS